MQRITSYYKLVDHDIFAGEYKWFKWNDSFLSNVCVYPYLEVKSKTRLHSTLYTNDTEFDRQVCSGDYTTYDRPGEG